MASQRRYYRLIIVQMFRLTSLLIILCLPLFAEATSGKTLVVINRTGARKAGEPAVIVLDWKELTKHNPSLGTSDFTISDTNFGKEIFKKVVDTNDDGSPDEVVVRMTFGSNEPLFGLAIQATSGPLSVAKNASLVMDRQYQLTYLYNLQDWTKKDANKIESWPDKIIESTMSFYADPATLPIYAPGDYSYEYAFFLNAMFERWKETKNPLYYTYIKKWADRFLDSHGSIDAGQYKVAEYRLDDILPGRVFISLYEVTKDNKYKNAANQLKNQLQYQPRTSSGGYWHKQTYPHQMWLDGTYMAEIFCMQYATVFNEPGFYTEAYRQIKLISDNTLNTETGLMYHGWDESFSAPWANPDTGASPEYWSRAMGWYLMALVDCLDYFPLTMVERKEVGRMSQDLAKSIMKYQDKKTSLWFQVIDKAHEPANWIETSGSAMFAYAIAKQFHKGVLRDKAHFEVAQKAFKALTEDHIYLDDQGRIYMDQTVKIGTLNPSVSKGDFEYYAGTERRLNDYKGLAALLYLSMEMDEPSVKKESD
jgi:unsaturated rhamnogalacturonyl hydrolase